MRQRSPKGACGPGQGEAETSRYGDGPRGGVVRVEGGEEGPRRRTGTFLLDDHSSLRIPFNPDTVSPSPHRPLCVLSTHTGTPSPDRTVPQENDLCNPEREERPQRLDLSYLNFGDIGRTGVLPLLQVSCFPTPGTALSRYLFTSLPKDDRGRLGT